MQVGSWDDVGSCRGAAAPSSAMLHQPPACRQGCRPFYFLRTHLGHDAGILVVWAGDAAPLRLAFKDGPGEVHNLARQWEMGKRRFAGFRMAGWT